MATKRQKQRAPGVVIETEVSLSKAPSLIERYHVEGWIEEIAKLAKKITEKARTLDGCFSESQVRYLTDAFALELTHESHLLSHKDYHLTLAKRYEAQCPFMDY